jgi:A/G-specific adenine glycosylase
LPFALRLALLPAVPGAKRRPASQLRLFAPARIEEAQALDPAERARAVAVALGAWFEGVARDLPWRRERAPYSVWLSEIMLQQTRVDTVVPYFQRFLARFPDVRALAAAELDDVLHLWSGLGYYRRARQLHATAREVTQRYGGVFPAEAPELRALPGIGAYTAGAIASIAYGKREPLVDGNVARVLARLEGIADPIKSPTTVRRVWAVAARLLPDDRPGRFNEALMELGATVCTPRDPRCDACPLGPYCVALASGRERELPVTESKRPAPVVEAVAAVLVDTEGRVLFARRREGGLFGGLWEPPMIEGEASPSAARPRFKTIGLDLGRGPLRTAGQVTHLLSHRRMSVTVAVGDRPRRIEAAADLAEPYERAAWLDPGKPGVGVSTLARKVLAAARAFGGKAHQADRRDEKG